MIKKLSLFSMVIFSIACSTSSTQRKPAAEMYSRPEAQLVIIPLQAGDEPAINWVCSNNQAGYYLPDNQRNPGSDSQNICQSVFPADYADLKGIQSDPIQFQAKAREAVAKFIEQFKKFTTDYNKRHPVTVNSVQVPQKKSRAEFHDEVYNGSVPNAVKRRPLEP